MEILIVEDEIGLGKSLNNYLSLEGFIVEVAQTLRKARESVEEEPDLIVLDWTLPDGNGIELLRELRKKEVLTPVIMLTAKSELIDKVLGLELGANDYLTKPFEPRELLARINAQLRVLDQLKGNHKHPKYFHEEKTFSNSGIEMNTGIREVRYLGRKVELTRMEFELLRVFLEAPNQVLSRTELLNNVWGYDNFPTTRTVDNHVAQLRKKLGLSFFELVHRVGYRFVPQANE